MRGRGEPGPREASSGGGVRGRPGTFLFSAGEICLGAGGLKSLEKVESGGPVGRCNAWWWGQPVLMGWGDPAGQVL